MTKLPLLRQTSRLFLNAFAARPNPHFGMAQLCCLLFLSPFIAEAQNTTGYRPAETSSAAVPLMVAKMDKRLASDLAALPKLNQKYLAKEYRERVDTLKSELLQGNFLMDSRWNAWFQGVLDEILRNNPDIPASDIILLVSREESPNAYCVGEGTLVFNLSMLPFLRSEGQTAFILCHELAHYVNNHANQSIHQYINTLYSPETQKQLKEIVKGKINKTERALALMKTMLYNRSRHSRFKESEADSLGLVFFSRTRYPMTEAISALEILDSIDHHTWPAIPYSSIFNAAGFPFQNAWLEQQTSGGLSSQPAMQTETFDEDSLKTHPDCQKRISLIRQAVGIKSDGELFLQPAAQFEQLQQWAPYEVVEGLYQRGHYGRALFRALVLLTEQPDNAYLNAMVVQSLYEISRHQRMHQLRYVLDLPEANYSAEYNRFLRFINQFRVSDLEKLAYHFSTERWEKFQADEAFVYAAILAAHSAGAEATFKSRKDTYLNTFPQGVYLQQIRSLN